MSKTAITTIGIDLGKNSFHVIGFDRRGAIVLRQKRSRHQLESSLANIPACLISMEDEHCRRLMTAPGIGPITSSAMVAAIGTGDAFAKGRDFAAWLGLVPKQISTGDRTILTGITKRGNRYLRTLFIQGARSVLMRRQTWPNHGFGAWLAAA